MTEQIKDERGRLGYDMDGKPLMVNDLVEIQYCSGRYGQTSTMLARIVGIQYGQGRVTPVYAGYQICGNKLIEQNNTNVTFGGEFELHDDRWVGHHVHDSWEHSHETYIKKIER